MYSRLDDEAKGKETTRQKGKRRRGKGESVDEMHLGAWQQHILHGQTGTSSLALRLNCFGNILYVAPSSDAPRPHLLHPLPYLPFSPQITPTARELSPNNLPARRAQSLSPDRLTSDNCYSIFSLPQLAPDRAPAARTRPLTRHTDQLLVQASILQLRLSIALAKASSIMLF